MLQILCKLAADIKTLYVTEKESLWQVQGGEHRFGLSTNELNMLSETDIK
ncbi:hypothetical protein [Candidatus Doolittlea endobia]|nr:hypothetical protein [Candidatus Doolittlea endobia]